MNTDFQNVIAIEETKSARVRAQKEQTPDDMTNEQFLELLDSADQYQGTKENLSRVERFNALRDISKRLYKNECGIEGFEESGVSKDKRNASIFLDFCPATFMSGRNLEAFKRAVSLADDFYFIMAQGKNAGIRMTFVVENTMSE